jgi:uncharacterized RDD family membrane protein YckC
MERAAGSAFCPGCGEAVAADARFCPGCGRVLGGVEYAGFWIRFASYIIDFIILFVVGIVLALAIGGTSGTVLQIAVGLVYTIGFWVAQGATPGKMAVGIKITTVDGGDIDFGRALLRYVGYIASALILLIGYLMIAFTREKRGLHDYIAGTVVIKTR